jgi:hypothetical protein
MRQPMMRHARTRPMSECIRRIVGRLVWVAFQYGDVSTTPGKGKAHGQTGWASADDHHFTVGHSSPPATKVGLHYSMALIALSSGLSSLERCVL